MERTEACRILAQTSLSKLGSRFLVSSFGVTNDSSYVCVARACTMRKEVASVVGC
jgi:hypothetical protein